MAYEFIKTENRDGIVIVTIDNEKNLNALNVKILKEIYNVFDELNEDKSVDVIKKARGLTDFNDLHKFRGLNEVRRMGSSASRVM